MHTVLPSDSGKIDQGLLVEEAQNRGIGIFSPDLFFDHLVSNYRIAEQLYGEKLLKLVTGYTGNYLERNIKIPEFQKMLKEKLHENIKELNEKGIIDATGQVTQKGLEMAALAVAIEELDTPSSIAGQTSTTGKTKDEYGERDELHQYKTGDKYRNLNVRKTITSLIKHGRTNIQKEDLMMNTRIHKGTVNIVYALDASASMKGNKLQACRRAGISLAYKAIKKKDKVGLVVFGEKIKEAVEPTKDFGLLVEKMMLMTASRQTDFVLMIEKATQMLAHQKGQKHVIIISDAIPTAGEQPKEKTQKIIAEAHAKKISFSLVGIKLDNEGMQFAKKIVEIGGGRLYSVGDAGEIKNIVLQEYARIS